jgi:hypothetical protein
MEAVVGGFKGRQAGGHLPSIERLSRPRASRLLLDGDTAGQLVDDPDARLPLRHLVGSRGEWGFIEDDRFCRRDVLQALHQVSLPVESGLESSLDRAHFEHGGLPAQRCGQTHNDANQGATDPTPRRVVVAVTEE